MSSLRVQENLSLKPEVAENFRQAAKLAGLSKPKLLEQMVRDFLEDRQDTQAAQEALKEPGRISLEELKARHGL